MGSVTHRALEAAVLTPAYKTHRFTATSWSPSLPNKEGSVPFPKQCQACPQMPQLTADMWPLQDIKDSVQLAGYLHPGALITPKPSPFRRKKQFARLHRVHGPCCTTSPFRLLTASSFACLQTFPLNREEEIRSP